MAAEEKTEKATPKRRQDERKKGNVFQSNDVAAVCSLLVLFHSLKALAPMMYESFGECMHLFFSYASSPDIFWQEGGKGLFMKAVLVFFKQGVLQYRQNGPFEELHLRWVAGVDDAMSDVNISEGDFA